MNTTCLIRLDRFRLDADLAGSRQTDGAFGRKTELKAHNLHGSPSAACGQYAQPLCWSLRATSAAEASPC